MGNSGNSLKSCFVCRTNRLNYALDPFHVSRTMQHRETEERKTMKKTKPNEISTHAERHMKHPFFFLLCGFCHIRNETMIFNGEHTPNKNYSASAWASKANSTQRQWLIFSAQKMGGNRDEKKSKKNSRRRLENACLHKCNFVAIDELCAVCSQPTARKKSVRTQNHIKQLVVGG